MSTADENTPLLSEASSSQSDRSSQDGATGKATKASSLAYPELRLLIVAFITWVGFSLTQVPILFAFRLMVCEDLYGRTSPFPDDEGDSKCNRKEVDEGTTVQLALVGIFAVLFSLVNLYFTGIMMRRCGPRMALIVNNLLPVLRVLVQILGVVIGARPGIIVFQSSQMLNMIGGPAGGTLALNTAISELVAPAERTGAFGKLQGVSLIATALGYLLGGIIGEAYVIERPFQGSGVILAVSTVYTFFFIPYIDPKTMGDDDKDKNNKSSEEEMHTREKKRTSFLGVLAPQRLRLEDGRVIKYYGALILAVGIFTGVLASGYAPILIQLYAVGNFHFSPSENSILMSVNSLIRGFFLILIFPVIIKSGRRWFVSADTKDTKMPEEDTLLVVGDVPRASDIDPAGAIMETEPEPTKPPAPVTEEYGAAFDLFFLQWSMLFDAVITGCIAFATQGWHIYLAGFLLPFASGSAPASKGVLTEICPSSQRAEALQAMTMIEYVATVFTMGLFGFVFYAFVSIDKAYLTFLCNAALALVAIFILLFASLPLKNSRVEEPEEGDLGGIEPQDGNGNIEV